MTSLQNLCHEQFLRIGARNALIGKPARSSLNPECKDDPLIFNEGARLFHRDLRLEDRLKEEMTTNPFSLEDIHKYLELIDVLRNVLWSFSLGGNPKVNDAIVENSIKTIRGVLRKERTKDSLQDMLNKRFHYTPRRRLDHLRNVVWQYANKIEKELKNNKKKSDTDALWYNCEMFIRPIECILLKDRTK